MEFIYHLAKEQIMNVFVMEDFFKKPLGQWFCEDEFSIAWNPEDNIN